MQFFDQIRWVTYFWAVDVARWIDGDTPISDAACYERGEKG
jgi:hypothetical protein